MEPRALLFDEPTSALDPELEQEVVRVIKALADEGRTMLLVTHDMKLAADCSDHVIFLHPVSCTHLDVYKRQLQALRPPCARRRA